MSLPTEAKARKEIPLATGCLDYFPAALAAVANVSFVGNEQHNPGTPLHWDRSKSGDEADAMLRHFSQRGTIDPKNGLRHSAQMAWRALALLQKEIEAEATPPVVIKNPSEYNVRTIRNSKTGEISRTVMARPGDVIMLKKDEAILD